MKDDFTHSQDDYLKIRVKYSNKIPDSVIIKNSLPCNCFFTCKEGLMKKKT